MYSVYSVNPSYIIINEVEESISEKNRNKYLTFASTVKNKKVLEKYTNLWDKIKYHIQTISADKSGEYERDCMEIKFNSDDDLPLNKVLKVHNLTNIVRSMLNTIHKFS